MQDDVTAAVRAHNAFHLRFTGSLPMANTKDNQDRQYLMMYSLYASNDVINYKYLYVLLQIIYTRIGTYSTVIRFNRLLPWLMFQQISLSLNMT